jgi:hypothetical protein
MLDKSEGGMGKEGRCGVPGEVDGKVDEDVDVHTLKKLMGNGDPPAQEFVVLVPSPVSVHLLLAVRGGRRHI